MAVMAMPSEKFMRFHVAIRWKDSIVLLNESEKEKHIIWMYNLWTEQWRKYELPRGKCLPKTYHHRGVEIASDIYMFGGFSYSDMLWKLARNTDDSFVWNTIEFKDCAKTPSLRTGHAVWEYKEKMWIFGGYGVSPAGYLNDHGDFAHVTRTLTNRTDYGYTNQLLFYDPLMQTWTNVPCSGDVPAPCTDISTAQITDKFYLHGGLPLNKPYRNHMYELDMHSTIWSRIETSALISYFGQTDIDFSLTPVITTVYQLVFYGDGKFGNGNILIFDVQSHTWKEHLGTLTGYDYNNTGITGLHGSVIILGRDIQPEGKAYNPVITVRLGPKRLQQLAMQQVDTTLWEMLPKKLTRKIMGTE